MLESCLGRCRLEVFDVFVFHWCALHIFVVGISYSVVWLFLHVFQPETWSRPRRRRDRRPHEMQETLLMFALLVPFVFRQCLDILSGVVHRFAFSLFLKRAPMLRQVLCGQGWKNVSVLGLPREDRFGISMQLLGAASPLT